MDKSVSDEEKVDILFHWWQLLDYLDQVPLTLNDNDARLMKIKDKGQNSSKCVPPIGRTSRCLHPFT